MFSCLLMALKLVSKIAVVLKIKISNWKKTHLDAYSKYICMMRENENPEIL